MTSPPRTALISVSDKTGLVALGRALSDHGFVLLSTGGSAQQLLDARIPVTMVSEHTGFPEIMGGRVKTLHPKIHGGILGRREIDAPTMTDLGIDPIDLVVVNLYPFADTTKDPQCTLEAAIEQIDIGGPAMIRSAAKNHQDVTVVCDPKDYDALIEGLPHLPTAEKRQTLAVKAFAHTAQYDGQISQWLSGRVTAEDKDPSGKQEQTNALGVLPPVMNIALEQVQTLRYGENPHQAAALYRERGASSGGIAGALRVQGKPLSYNNLLDADAALSAMERIRAVADQRAVCVVVKHTNPCGAAIAQDALKAWEKALATDPTSAFGGIVAISHPLEAPLAEQLVNRFLEVIIAPAISDQAKAVLAAKPNVRVLVIEDSTPPLLDIRSIDGGYLVQQTDHGPTDHTAFEVVTERVPTATEQDDLLFAWAVVRSVRSNAIVYAKQGQTLGLGVGQMSRIDSARFGVLKSQDAGLSVTGAVMASEAFFPFADSIEAAAAVGVGAVIQPGGSIRDEEVIAACNKAGIAMVLTHRRHFKH